MIDVRSYCAALDAALMDLGFDGSDMDRNNFVSFYWGMISSAYMELVQPVVSLLPVKAAECVGKSLSLWADGRIKCGDDIIGHAQRNFSRWFKGDFMGIWRAAALRSRRIVSAALEGHFNSFLSAADMPGTELGIFAMEGCIAPLEKNLREKALKFMLHEIFSYEFTELDDEAEDRRALLDRDRKALRDERDFRVGLERVAISETLVDDALLFSFANEIYRELLEKLLMTKRGLTAAGN